MADYSVSINKGVDGFKASDLTAGTSAPGAGSIELRLSDAAGLTRKDVYIALEAFRRWFESKDTTTYPPL